MRLACLADVHLDSPFAWATPALAAARRQAIRASVDAALVEASSCDALLIAGDLYEHDRFSPDTASFLRSRLADMSIPVLVAPGNHDYLGPDSLYRLVSWSSNVHIFDTEDLTAFELDAGFLVWGGAHLRPAGTSGFLDKFSAPAGDCHVAVFHGSEQASLGAQGSNKQPHAPFTVEQIPRAGLTYAFTGHYHRPSGSMYHSYPGNPCPLAFAEAGTRGLLVAEVSPTGATVDRIQVSQSVLEDVVVDVSGASTFHDIVDRTQGKLTRRDTPTRITFTGELAADLPLSMVSLRAALPDYENIVLRSKVYLALDLEELSHEMSVRGQFIRDTKAAQLDGTTQALVLHAGLRALSGELDVGLVGSLSVPEATDEG